MLKWMLKWALRALVLGVVLAVIFFLSLDTLLRLAIEHNIRKQTGLEAEIGRFHLGLTEPVVEIKDLQLYNPADFGGTLFLNIPEIHVEYNRAALRQGEIHITLLRFNLGELDVVKNASGATNLLALGVALPTAQVAAKSKDPQGSPSNQLAQFQKQTGLDFKGIDVLNVSVGKARYIDLKDQRNNHDQNIGIDNQVIKNVQSSADLAGLALLVALRSGDFFGPLVSPGSVK